MSSNTRPAAPARDRQIDLLIAGASARATAQSAARGGLRVAAMDLFADTDLCEIAEARRARNWPGEILAWTREYPATIPFLYAGGLENFPDLLDRIGKERRVAGVAGACLRELRNPGWLARWCAARGIRFPRLATIGQTHGKRLLVKPVRSVAGLGIRDFDQSPIAAAEYLQECIPGAPVSAAYLLTNRRAELLATFRLLALPTGEAETPRSYLYRGSVTCRLASAQWLEQLGHHLLASGARGPCGVDFIEAKDGELVLLEVNPRYTASMELWEQRTGRSIIGEYIAGNASTRPDSTAFDGSHRGKRIVFARRPVAWRMPHATILPSLPLGMPRLADIPPWGTVIGAGEPICTVFAIAETFEECQHELDSRQRQLLSHLESDRSSR